MFLHNFKYSFITLFKNKSLIFWTFAFPIILGTLFYLAFSDIEDSEKLKIIDIAIVENNEFKTNEIYQKTFQELSDKNNKDQLFNTKYTSLKKAKQLLEDKKITAYLVATRDNMDVVINKNGINETIVQNVVEEMISTIDLTKNSVEYQVKKSIEQGNFQIDTQKIVTQVTENINNIETPIKEKSKSNLSYTMIEFYTLIAMVCLYGGILGMTSMNQVLANMSGVGKRVQVGPVSKLNMILSSTLSSYIVQLIGVFLLILYTIFVLNVDYGDNTPQLILLTLVGSLAGLSLGVMIAAIVKKGENTKTGIILGLTMLGCFLSGMMGISMKYIIDKNVPIINKINPASMITDGFYSLYYYKTFDRFYFDIISLLAFSFIMIFIAYASLRRAKYDSI